MDQKQKPVWKLRVAWRDTQWNAMQAAETPQKAWEMYTQGYRAANIDISDYRCVGIYQASSAETEHYWSDSGY